MSKKTTYMTKGLGLIFALIFVAFSCVDLHRFSHEDLSVVDDCALCILVHTQHQGDHFLPAESATWEPEVFLAKVERQILFRGCETFSSQRVVCYFNKAPPVI